MDFQGLSAFDQWMLILSIVGGAVFLISHAMQFLGGGLEGGLAEGGLFENSDYAFSFLSVQGLSTFFMIFGIIAYGVNRLGAGLEVVAILSGLLAGYLVVLLVKGLFRLMLGFQSTGNLQLDSSSVGEEGTVYLTIRPGETGQIELSIKNRYRVIDAELPAESSIEALLPGAKVRVQEILSQDKVIVLPLQNEAELSNWIETLSNESS